SSEVLEAIENVIQDVLKSLAQKKAPVLTLANRSDWRNIEEQSSKVLITVFDPCSYNVGSVQLESTKTFKCCSTKARNCFSIIITNTIFCLDRDIYYSDTLLFGSQSVVDNIINDISCMLKIPRRSLHIVS
ncbi:SPO11 protein, partial [Pandion haliaetus]|nr:SPO11 protein [Pandion haliaetus]